MTPDKELQNLKNRFRDLADKSFNQNIFTFTGFLGLSEQDLFWQMEKELSYAGFTLNGAREMADRKMIRFGNPEVFGYEVDFPIVCIHIEPVMEKFAEKLNHRDFLGALMNLGIERSTMGDIMVGEKDAYLFCQEAIAPFICDNLGQIRHTHVKCSVTKEIKDLPTPEAKKEIYQVSSARVDAMIAKVYQQSRNDCLTLFRQGLVFINGRVCENNAKQLKEGDVVNARGFGKFVFDGVKGETKKGKLNVEVSAYR